ncbi:MAG TPA: oligosaccharide flippase family protein [Methanomassiliicoccales archaeon]|nr:oligosaccharide flippase family protein [Methanomassiliicoccales archaeon]
MIGRKSLFVFSTLAVNLVFQLVGMLFITRLYPPEVYGSITIALSFVAIFDCLANLGFNSAHVKRVSEGKDLSDCVSTFVVLKLALTFSMAFIVLASVYLWTEALGHYLSAESKSLIEIFLVYQVMYDLVSIAILTFNGRTEMSKAYLVNLLDPMVRIPLIAIIALTQGSIYQLAMAYIVGSSLVLMAGLYMLKRERIPWKRPTLYRSYLAFAAPIAPIAILETVSNNIDKLLIGAFGGTASVAYYASAKYLLCAVGAVGLAVSLNAFPAFSSSVSRGNFIEVRRVARDVEKYVSFLVTPMIIVLILFPTEICIFFFGPTFSPAGEPLRYLSIASLLVVLNQVYLSLILGLNRPKISAKIAFLDFAVFLGLMLYLIPPEILGHPAGDLSFVGAAMAAAITAVMTTMVIRFAVWRLTSTKPNSRMLLHALAAITTGLLLAIIADVYSVLEMFGPGHEIFGVVLFTILAYAVFEGTLYFMKELTKKDIDFMMNIFSLREMWRYVRSELGGKKE